MIGNHLAQIGFFRNPETTFSIPEALYSKSVCDYTALADISKKVYRITDEYPNLRRTVINKLSLYNHFYGRDEYFDISKVLVRISRTADDPSPILIDLISFSFCDFSTDLNLYTIEAYYEYREKRINLQNFPQFLEQMDFSSIRKAYAIELDDFWKKNLDSYRVLAKFSFLCALLQQQKIEGKTLSPQSLELIGQTIGINMVEFKEITKDVMTSLYTPSRVVEVSVLTLGDKALSDIFFISDVKSDLIVLYIPKYDPCFTEFESKEEMINWIALQSQISSKSGVLPGHFPLSNRSKHSIQKSALQDELVTQDIFSSMALIQKARSKDDLYTVGSKVYDVHILFPEHFSTEAAIFITIDLAIKSISQYIPEVASISDFLEHAFPNPYKIARESIQTEVKDKWGLNIDPDKVFIRFPVKRKDFAHALIPIEDHALIYEETISLTGATLSNYQSYYLHTHTQAVAYMDPSGMSIYIDGTELDLPLEEIHNAIVNLNLNDKYVYLMEEFWRNHANRVKSFVKSRYLQQVINEYYGGFLSKKTFELLADVGINSLIVEENSSYEIFNQNISVKQMRIGEHAATDIFLFQDRDQPLLVLYIASDIRPFSVFSNENELQDFLIDKSKMKSWMSQIVLHFPIKSRNLASQELSARPISIGSMFFSTQSKADLFDIICKNIRQQSDSDTDTFIAYRKSPNLEQSGNTRFEHIEYINNLSRGSTALLALSFVFPILNRDTFALFPTSSWEESFPAYLLTHSFSLEERYQAGVSLNLSKVEIFIGFSVSIRMLRANF